MASETTARILVVEDEESIAMLYRALLESRGYAVKFAATLREGLEDLERSRPDLVVLDLQLGDDDGLELLRSLKRRRETADVPVLISTVENTAHAKHASRALGVSGYLIKPFENRRFLDLVTGLLEAAPA